RPREAQATSDRLAGQQRASHHGSGDERPRAGPSRASCRSSPASAAAFRLASRVSASGDVEKVLQGCFENYLNVLVADVVRQSAGAVSQTKVEQMLEWLVFHNSAPASAARVPAAAVAASTDARVVIDSKDASTCSAGSAATVVIVEPVGVEEARVQLRRSGEGVKDPLSFHRLGAVHDTVR
ncbi:hypothetical protein HK405_003221, partial [Cladochytrium tenue]